MALIFFEKFLSLTNPSSHDPSYPLEAISKLLAKGDADEL